MFRRTRTKPRPAEQHRERPLLTCPECGSDKACPIEADLLATALELDLVDADDFAVR